MEDVYNVVNEDEYSNIVRKRQEEDWVVDDGEKIYFKKRDLKPEFGLNTNRWLSMNFTTTFG